MFPIYVSKLTITKEFIPLLWYPAEENRCGDYNINTFVIFECVLVYLSKKKCELGFLGLSKRSIMKDSWTNALYLVSHPENIFLSVCKAGRNVKPPLTHWGKIVNDPPGWDECENWNYA